jgi:hypothetical protein
MGQPFDTFTVTIVRQGNSLLWQGTGGNRCGSDAFRDLGGGRYEARCTLQDTWEEHYVLSVSGDSVQGNFRTIHLPSKNYPGAGGPLDLSVTGRRGR